MLKNFVRTVPMLVGALLLGACATSGGGAGKVKLPKELEKRAEHRWAMLIERKAENAYDYLTPGFRKTKTREAYAAEMNNRALRWTKAGFLEKKCDEADVCDVAITVEFSVPMPGAGTTPGFSVLHEKWMQISGQWYYLPEKLGSSTIDKPAK